MPKVVIGTSAWLAAIALTLCATVSAHAVDYVEATDGDLAGSLWTTSGGTVVGGGTFIITPTTFPALDLGLNTLTGTSSVGDAFNNLDRDGFTIVVPSGMLLDTLTVDLDMKVWIIVTSHYAGSEYVAMGTFYGSGSPGEKEVNSSDLTDGGPATNVDLLALAGSPGGLGPGEYGITIRNGLGYNTTTDYTFYLNLIPEPGALLLCTAGGVVMLMRRRASR